MDEINECRGFVSCPLGLSSLTVFCPILLSVSAITQLPSPVLQTCIATHESNGIDIIIALILNDINPLGKYCMDLVLQLKVQ